MIAKASLKPKQPKHGNPKGSTNSIMAGRGRGWGSGAGRPALYDPKMDRKVFKMRLLGLSDNDIGDILGVSGMSINNWRKWHPTFAKAWERGGMFADAKVAYSLWRRANGWSHEATKIFNNRGVITKVPYTERYPPDTEAIELWLTNRQPDVWKKRRSQELTGANGTPPYPPPPVLVLDFSGDVDGPLIEGDITDDPD